MIEVIPTENTNIVGLKIDGKIETADIVLVEEAIADKLTSHQKLRAYVELNRLGGISLEALLEDLKMAMRHLKDFDRKAVVADESWLTKLGMAVSKFFPNIEAKCFPRSEPDKAMEWLKSN